MSEKKPMLSVEEALAAILANVAPLETEDAALTACYGRTLARDIAARRTQPPSALSAMDGYALRAADAARPLRVIGEFGGGKRFWRDLRPRARPCGFSPARLSPKAPTPC